MRRNPLGGMSFPLPQMYSYFGDTTLGRLGRRGKPKEDARQEDLRQVRFALVEFCALPIPPTRPQFGIELTAGWARRGWQGGIARTRLHA